jgi:apolipoprotein N-acyltransferase
MSEASRVKILLSSPRGRYLLAFGAGVLQSVSFPTIGFSWLAWLAPGLILLVSVGHPRTFRLGFCAGLGHYLVSLGWLLRIPLPGRAVASWLAVSGYLALYTAAWSWVCWKIFPRATIPAKEEKEPLSPSDGEREKRGAKGAAQSNALPLDGEREKTKRTPHSNVLPSDEKREKTLLNPALGAEGRFLRDGFLRATWGQRARWALFCAAGWVAMEMVIARGVTGFPWNLLGASQYRRLPLIQIASVLGIYGVSFLIVWFSVSLASAVMVGWRRCQPSATWVRELALPLIAVLAALGFGYKQLARTEPVGRELKLALVQPSIPQPVIWDPAEKINRFNKLVALSEEALAAQPDLLVWPEAAMPDMFSRFNPVTYQAITNLVLPHKIWMILGADDALPKPEVKGQKPEVRSQREEVNFFNGSFLVSPSGQLAAKYYKRRLVVLGEYIPFADSLPFLNYLRQSKSGFTPGEGQGAFEITEPKAKIALLICFEDVFPQLVRHDVDNDTDFLLNLTNNGWFGNGAAQWQHAVSALFRAVENGLPLVRCTNNGLTCWIDAQGRMHEVYFPGSRDIYQAGFKIARVPLRASANGHRERTIYNHFGDCFGWACVGITCLLLIASLRPASRR